jgi:hypothetical protein
MIINIGKIRKKNQKNDIFLLLLGFISLSDRSIDSTNLRSGMIVPHVNNGQDGNGHGNNGNNGNGHGNNGNGQNADDGPPLPRQDRLAGVPQNVQDRIFDFGWVNWDDILANAAEEAAAGAVDEAAVGNDEDEMIYDPGEWGYHPCYQPSQRDTDYTVQLPGVQIMDDPPLSEKFGDQVCYLSRDGRQFGLYRQAAGGVIDGNVVDFPWIHETHDLPVGFEGQAIKFFDAADTLCVIVFATDGNTTVIFDFQTGQELGGGQMPENIQWGVEGLLMVSYLADVGIQVMLKSAAGDIRTITIAV